MNVQNIKIEDIVIPEQRARASFTDEQRAELKASIEKHGFSVPILVRRRDDGKYELIDGEHRIEVVKELGWTEIPAVISEASDLTANMLNILANTARGTQNTMDIAEALRRAYDAGASVEELAAATGHTQEWVCRHLTLTEMPDWVQDAVREQRLSIGHIDAALELDDEREVFAALETALQLNWQVSTLRNYVQQRLDTIKRLSMAGSDPYVAQPPTPQYAQTVVSYGDCMICQRKVNRADLYMPAICIDCRSLLEWIINTLGNPKDAMQTIYNALQWYFEAQRRMNLGGAPQQQQVQQPIVQSSQVQQPEPTVNTTSTQLSDEDMRLIKLIKSLKEAGAL